MRISPTQQVGCSGSVLVFLLSLFFTPNLLAVTKNWTSGSGNWSPGNWSPAGVPAATDPTRIVHTDGVPRTVTLNTNTPSLGLVAIDLTGSGTAANTLSIPNNNSLTVGGMIVGGHNGIAYTNGRGALTQADGTVTLSSGLDLSVGGGTGSNGTYTLNGGNLIANQSEYVGLFGTGTFHQSGGTNLINPGAIGSFGVGVFAGSNGTYNLSGGLLDSRKSQYIGDQGIGVFNHTGGTNRLFGLSHDLYLGFSAGGNGTYNISGGRLEMLALSDLVVGNNGTGTLNISGTGEVSASNVIVGTGSTLSIQGGKLRLDSFSPNFAYVLSYGSGAIQFSGIRTLTSDLTIGSFFGNGNPVIPVNKELIVENTARITNNSAVLVNGGKLESLGLFEVGGATGTGSLGILSGGSAKALDFAIGTNGSGGIVNIDSGSSLVTVSGVLVGQTYSGLLDIKGQSLVDVGGTLDIGSSGMLRLNNSTLRFNSYQRTAGGQIDYQSGTISLLGPRTIGADTAVADFYGTAPTITLGKTLVVEHISTLTTPLSINRGHFKTNSLVIGAGGALDFERGVLEINGGVIQGMSQLVVPAEGELRGRAFQGVRIVGAVGSTMTATGNWGIGDSTATNGFYTNGTLNTGQYAVTLLDANDAVLDSGALVNIGSGGIAGILDAPNGLTLDFGGNIQGFGTITTPNNIAKPLINNGHIAGTSGAQPLTLAGYVKGVGTLDNVNITGTYSPGLSPTIVQASNLILSPTSTLVMELGGTTPGSGYDQLQVAGDLVLGGALVVSFINGFAPTPGQMFDLFDSSSILGAFSSVQLPAVPGLSWNTSQLASGIIGVVSAGIPGDYNNNGTVDAADYTLYRDALGTNITLPNDTTPGSVTTADLAVWQANFGQGGPSAAAAVPEPAAFFLVLAAWLMVAGVTIRQSSCRLHFRVRFSRLKLG